MALITAVVGAGVVLLFVIACLHERSQTDALLKILFDKAAGLPPEAVDFSALGKTVWKLSKIALSTTADDEGHYGT